MTTRPLLRTALAVAVSLLAAGDHTATAVPGDTRAAAAVTRTFTPHVLRTRGHAPALAPAYGWPVEPFDRQHPVRAFLNDPRIGREGGRSFHFGIDVAAPDGTPVYAVEGGVVYLSHGSLAVQVGPRHVFGYWHIRAAAGLKQHDAVATHQLLGTIAPGWGHVHFAERIGDDYVNPLRPGGLGPYADPVPPTIGGISVTPEPGGRLQLVVRAWDTTWPRVPGPWANEPVTPALLRWRVSRAGGPAGSWRTVADFSRHVLDRGLFGAVYAPETAQNHERRPGTYSFYLSHDWQPTDGLYRIEVAASDTRGNRAVGHLDVAVVNGEVQR